MSFEQSRYVVDASVGIKLSLPEDHSAQAEALFNRLSEDPPVQFFVPDLFYAECANILWKHVRRFGYPVSQARKDIVEVKQLALQVVPTAELMGKALELAVRLEISAYDACYVALAEELKAPLVTADEKLFKRLKGGRPVVKWIGDFPLGINRP